MKLFSRLPISAGAARVLLPYLSLALLLSSAATALPTGDEPPAEDTIPSTVLEGSVTDEEGAPVEGATVIAVSARARAPRRASGPLAFLGGGGGGEKHPVVETSTDESGAFRIEARGEAPFMIRVSAAGYAPTEIAEVVEGDLVSLVLGPGWTLRGTVVERSNGRPVAGAEITVAPLITGGFHDPEEPRRLHRTTTSDENGAYEVPDLEANFYRIQAEAEGFGRAVRDRISVGLDGRASPEVHLYLSPGATLSGRVLDPDGRPLEGAQVGVGPGGIPTNLEAWMNLGDAGGKTDEAGHFEIRGIPANPSYEVSVRHEDFASAWIEDVRVAEGRRSAPLEVRLSKGTSLVALLQAGEGKPFAGEVRVDLQYEGGTGPRQPWRRVHAEGDRLELKEGKLTVPRLPVGKAGLKISAPGYTDIERESVTLEDDRPLDLGTLMLDPGRGLEGLVLDEKGKPVAGAKIKARALFPGGLDERDAESDEKGAFRLGGMKEDMEYLVTVEAEGFGRAQQSVKAAGQALEIEMRRGAELRGRVVAGDPPRPMTGFSVRIEALEDDEVPMLLKMAGLARPRPEPFRDAQGLFSLVDLTPGAYSVKIEAEGFVDGRIDKVELAPGETTDLGEILLDRGATLRGVVVARETGEPVAGAAISESGAELFQQAMVPGMGQAGARPLSAPDGSFVIAGLSPGTHTFEVVHDSFARGSAQVDIEAGLDPGELTIELGPGGSVEGVVLDKTGQPLQSGMVMLMSGVRPDMRTIGSTDTFGFYRIEHVAPGSYQLLAMPQPTGGEQDQAAMLGSMQMAAVEIVEGEVSVLNLPQQQGSINVRGVVKKGRTPIEGRIFFARLAPDGATLEDFVAGLSDGSGAYQVRLNGPGHYDVRVQPKNLEDPMDPGVLLKIDIPDEPEVTQDLLVPEIALSGVVTDGETAEPIAGVRVMALVLTEEGGEPERDDIISAAETDETGRYSIEGIEPGVYRLLFSKPGYGETPLEAVEVEEDDELDNLDMALLPATPVTVLVVDSYGNPVEGAFVMPLEFSLAWLGGSGGETGMGGTIELKGLRDGTHDIGVIARGWAPGVARSVVVGPGGDRRVKVKLRRGGNLRLRVIDVDEAPVSGAVVRLREEDGPDLTRLFRFVGAFMGRGLTTDPSGILEIPNLEAGRYQITVSRGDLSVVETLRVRPGRSGEVEIALR